MHITVLRGALGAAACLAMASVAQAHVTLEKDSAAPDTRYRAVLRVPHGCAGAPTTGLTVTIPEGVIDAKPMPKPGWTVAVDKGDYARSYQLFGRSVSSGAKTIAWTGGMLGDDQYDEFVFVGRITDAFAPGARVAFPVVQNCGSAASRWVDIPAPGQDAHALKSPAPAIRVVASGAGPATAATSSGHAGHDMGAHDHASAPSDAPAPGQSIKAGSLTIDGPWMRATPGGASVAGGYVRITNAGDEPDRLLATTVPIAGRGEVHRMVIEGGVMKMGPVDGGLVIPARGSIELKPGGYHLMFLDLREGVRAGTTVAGTLTFEKAGTVPVTFQVGGLGAQSAPTPAKP